MQQSMSLQSIIEQVSKEKGIEPQVLVETMEQAILTAAKRTFGINRELEARFNDESGNVDLYQFMTVVDEVDDDEREISIADGWRTGPKVDKGARWEPDEVGAAVHELLGKRVAPEKVYGT